MPSRRDAGSFQLRVVATIVVAVLAIVATPAAASDGQRVVSFSLPSRLVDTSSPGGSLADGRTAPKVNVLLPNGYATHPHQRYPVLWLLHGAQGGADSWLAGQDDVRTLAKDLPAIVVMPDGGRYGMYTDWWNDGARTDPSWASYDLTVLRSAIEQKFRVLPGRRWHAIGGISMGGMGALRYAAMLPGYFGTVTTFSAAVPDVQAVTTQFGLGLLTLGQPGVGYPAIWGPAGGAYAEGNSPQALAANYGNTRMYLTSGNGLNCAADPIIPSSFVGDVGVEIVIHQQEGPFARAARAAGADVTATTTCGVHTFGVWQRAFLAAREWGFFRPVPAHPSTWTYRTVATSGQMWGLNFRFAMPPNTVATFHRTGNLLTGQGKGQLTIAAGQHCRFTESLPFSATLPVGCR